jgi:hypothetical protein
MVKSDLNDCESLFTSLIDAQFDCHKFTIIVLEVVLIYMDELARERLLSFLSNWLKLSIIIIFDPLLSKSPSDSIDSIEYYDYIHQMTHKFAQKGNSYLTKEDMNIQKQTIFLQKCQYKHILVKTITEALNEFLTRNERLFPIEREPFDEYGALAIIRQYYSISIASNNEQQYNSLIDKLYSKPFETVATTSTGTNNNNNNNSDSNSISEKLSEWNNRLNVVENKLMNLEKTIVSK